MDERHFQPGWLVRTVSEAELEQVLEVYRQCEDFLALCPQPKASMEMVLADLQHSRGEGGVFYGIFQCDEGQPERMVGVLDVVWEGYQGKTGEAYLALLMIAAPYRSKGIGASLFRWVEEEVQKRGEGRAILAGVQVNNPAAIRFWTRMGFAIISGPELFEGTLVYGLKKDL
jgi:ribosomal protein S18 acetylase RimI-like enzyme